MNRLQKLIQRTIIGALFIMPGIVFGQISITSSDAMALIGTSQVVETDTSGSMTVNVGSSGANQSWDMTSVSPQGYNVGEDYITPLGTPFETDFPSANFVNKITDTSGSEGFGEVIIYNYVEVTTSHYATLGGGLEVPGDTSFVLYMSDDVAPLPLTYGSQWISTESDTFGDPAIFATIDHDTTLNIVDGWGTIQLPIGTFNCLRIRANNRYTTLIVVGGQTVSETVTNTITYTWLSKNEFILAEAESQDNDINPNFTTAADFQRLVSSTTGIEDRPDVTLNPESFQLFQNYPNPFNPETRIKFELPRDAFVTVKIYDIMGTLVGTPVQEKMSSGRHSVLFSAAHLASGIYFYTLECGDFKQTRKMMLLK